MATQTTVESYGADFVTSSLNTVWRCSHEGFVTITGYIRSICAVHNVFHRIAQERMLMSNLGSSFPLFRAELHHVFFHAIGRGK
jgi:hypothetical protein